MAKPISVFEEHSAEYGKLQAVADMLSAYSGLAYVVENVYFDCGQDWWWTTIIGFDGSPWGGYQAITPKQQDDVLNGTLVDAMRVVCEVLERDKNRAWS